MIKTFQFKKVVLIYGPKYHMKYFYRNFELFQPFSGCAISSNGLKIVNFAISHQAHMLES